MTNQTRKIAIAEKDAQAVALRAEGMTLDQIADRLGYGSRSSAWRSVERGIKRVPEPAVTQLRAVQDAALDRAQQVTFGILTNVETSDDIRLKAVHAAVRVLERRARLHGLDAPVQVHAAAGFQVVIDPNWLPENANIAAITQPIPEATSARRELKPL